MAWLFTRIEGDLLHEVDALVSGGVVASRFDAVRLGLEQLIHGHRWDGADAEMWSDASTVQMIRDEPW